MEEVKEETKEVAKPEASGAGAGIGIDIGSLNPPEQVFVNAVMGLLVGMQTFKKLPAKKPPKPFDPLLGTSVAPEQCGYQIRLFQLPITLAKKECRFVDSEGGDAPVAIETFAKFVPSPATTEILKI